MTVLNIEKSRINCNMEDKAKETLEQAITVLQDLMYEMETNDCDNYQCYGGVSYSEHDIYKIIGMLTDLEDIEEIF